MRCQGLVQVRTLAAEFCTHCSLLSNEEKGIAVVLSGGYEGMNLSSGGIK
jgi:hypothetical protein